MKSNLKAYSTPGSRFRHGWLLFLLFLYCVHVEGKKAPFANEKQPVIFDTDANNELDDQHALAYLLLNGNSFAVKGITVNATIGGGELEKHYNEALRITKFCGLEGKIPVIRGANGNFRVIEKHTGDPHFDGAEAVDFIIRQAMENKKEKITIIAVGKLTNIALAIQKEPSIADAIRVVWLGSNYPEAGEYNLKADIPAMNYVLNSKVPFEMVVVRYNRPSGSDAVRVTQTEMEDKMPGKGPVIQEGIPGRHGKNKLFTTFGDYSVELFQHINYKTDPPSRALFDLVAVAILKNPDWGRKSVISAPFYENGQWVDRKDYPRKIAIWEKFERNKIIEDFFRTMESYTLAETND